MERVCRTCLCEGAYVDIFERSTSTSTSSPSTSSPSICTMVTDCTQLNMSKDDGLPAHICGKCLDIVVKAFSFKLQASKAEQQLKNNLSTSNKSNVPENSTTTEENCRDFTEVIIIKTEIDHLADENDVNNAPVSNRDNSDDDLEGGDSDNDTPVCNSDRDDSDDDLQPLIGLKNSNSNIEDRICQNKLDQAISCDVSGLEFNQKDQLILHTNSSHRESKKRGCSTKQDTNNKKLKKTSESVNCNKSEIKSTDLSENSEKKITIENTKFVTTQRNGASMITVDGHCYTRHRGNGETEYWQCNWKGNCYGRVITRNNRQELVQSKEHSHLPDGLKREMIELKSKIRLLASSDAIGTSSILRETLSTTSEMTKARLPKLDSLKRRIQMQRSKARPQQLARTRSEINVPAEFQNTGDPNRSEQFLMWDSGIVSDGDDRILMFSTQKNIDFLRSCRGVFMNDSFGTAPQLFEQLYTIHGTRQDGPNQLAGKAIPLIYFFLPDKTVVTYMRAFAKLKTFFPGWESVRIMMSFEAAAVEAARKHWPNAQVTGCFLNLRQNINKKIKDLELTKFYGQSEENTIRFNTVAALAFVPQENVIDSWDELLLIMQPWVIAQTEEIQQKIYDFLLFFEQDFIGKRVEGVRCEPRVAELNIWNVRNQTLDGFHHTDIEVENFHKKLTNTIQTNSTNLWRVVKVLQNLQAETEKMIEESLSGPVNQNSRSQHVRLAKEIMKTTKNWSSRSDLENYLRNICFYF